MSLKKMTYAVIAVTIAVVALSATREINEAICDLRWEQGKLDEQIWELEYDRNITLLRLMILEEQLDDLKGE